VPIPLELTFVGMTPMLSVGLLIAERSTRLERFADNVIRCHVIVCLEHRSDRRGRSYSVDLDISTDLGSVAVSREPDASPRGLDELIRDAFDAAARELQADVGRSSKLSLGRARPECLS
jgi:ribosome-associated translation inhibitor RaiA